MSHTTIFQSNAQFLQNYKCNTEDISGTCITCAENRINPPNCDCPTGYLNTQEPKCPQERKNCLIPNDHILHINDSQNSGSVQIEGYKTRNSAYSFDGISSHRTFSSL